MFEAARQREFDLGPSIQKLKRRWHCTRTIARGTCTGDAVTLAPASEANIMMHSWKAALDAARIGESKYKILVQAVTSEIERGVLVHDQRLPPQRQVADALGISVQTCLLYTSDAADE